MTKFNNIVGLALILGLLHACGSKPNPEKEEAYQKAAEKFVADESFFPILDEELFYFNSQRVDTIGVDYMNEQEAVEKLLKQETWLAFTTRDYTAKEKKSLQDHKFRGYQMGRDIPQLQTGRYRCRFRQSAVKYRTLVCRLHPRRERVYKPEHRSCENKCRRYRLCGETRELTGYHRFQLVERQT